MKELINVNSRISVELKDKVTEYCKKNGLKIQFVMDKALNEYIDKREKEGN